MKSVAVGLEAVAPLSRNVATPEARSQTWGRLGDVEGIRIDVIRWLVAQEVDKQLKTTSHR